MPPTRVRQLCSAAPSPTGSAGSWADAAGASANTKAATAAPSETRIRRDYERGARRAPGTYAVTPSAARRNSAMSSFCIFSIAAVARSIFSGSPSASSSFNPSGTTCQETPYLSLHQPQALGAAGGELLPEVVDLCLVLAADLERDRLVELELRAAVDADELRVADPPPDRHDRARLLLADLLGCLAVAHDLADLGVVEDLAVEVGGLLGLAVEPKVRGDSTHALLLRASGYLLPKTGAAAETHRGRFAQGQSPPTGQPPVPSSAHEYWVAPLPARVTVNSLPDEDSTVTE